jgi:hypothetical protein
MHRRASERGKGPWAHMAMSADATWRRTIAPPLATSPIHVIAKVSRPRCISMLDPCQFDPKVEVELPWIDGPTVIDLEGPNQPSYCLTG